jgi:hypothetical protein
VEKIGALIGFVLSVVAFVQLAASGWSAFWEALTRIGGAFLIAFTLLCLFAALKSNRKDTPEDKKLSLGERAVSATLAIAVPAVSLWSLSRGDTVLRIAGTSLLVVTGFLIYQLYKERLVARAESVQTCPDCAEDVKAEAHICRYCGFRFSEVELTKSQPDELEP